MNKKFIGIAAIFGAMAVGLGAFGAHALKDMLAGNGRLETYETAVLYHFIHTLALLFVGLLMHMHESKWLSRAAWSFLAGIIVFSGSLYVLFFSGFTILGAVTPVGGLMFIIGWLFLAYFGLRKVKN